jgi:hypothetical protein
MIVYICHLSAEQSLKAYLMKNGVFNPNEFNKETYIHELPSLLKMCYAFDNSFSGSIILNHCIYLNRYKFAKYINYQIEVDSALALRAINSATKVYGFVYKRIIK